MANQTMEFREESDLLGSRKVPRDVYWGVQTLRARENFGVSLTYLYNYSTLVRALAMVKKACTLANRDLGHLKKKYADAITQACDEIISGQFEDQFIVDMMQGGAGTSSNMNCNEVIASRANEILGHPRNSMSPVGANDHVNMSQSTNDVYPTAIKVATIYGLRDLSSQLERLIAAMDEKAEQFKDLLKLGRTE